MLLEATRREGQQGARPPRIPQLWRGRFHSVRRLGWGVADQAVSSVTNFAVVFLVARSLGAVQFGAFSLAYIAYGFALNLSRGLGSYPFQVRYTGAEYAEWRRGAAESSGTALTTGIFTGCCMLAAAAVLSGATRSAFMALGLTLPGLLLQDSWRFAFFVLGRGRQAFLNDAIWAVAQFPAMLWLHATHEGAVFWFILSWGGAATVAAAVGPLQARVLPDLWAVPSWLSRQRDLAIRYATSDLIGSVGIQLRTTIVDGLLGLAVVGYVQAASTLMGPFMVAFYGISLVTVPEAVRVLQKSPRRLPLFSAAVSTGLIVAAVAWGSVLLLALPRGLGQLALGSIWRPTYALVVPQTLVVVGQAFSTGAGTGLSALGAAHRTLRAALIGSSFVLVCSVLGPLLGGAKGTIIGLAIASSLGGIVLWREFRAALREYEIRTVNGHRNGHRSRGRHRKRRRPTYKQA
jgi:O-antigen/teichoic acid export membrane protein